MLFQSQLSFLHRHQLAVRVKFPFLLSSVLDAFAKLRTATISFIVVVRLSSCPSVLLSTWNTMWLLLDESSWKLIFESFGKSIEKVQASLKSDKENGTALESK
jgi:hypothetical protein